MFVNGNKEIIALEYSLEDLSRDHTKIHWENEVEFFKGLNMWILENGKEKLMNKMQFTKEDLIGQVVYVDTNQVLVKLKHESINLLNVGSIVSIQTTRTYEFTIGLIDMC